MASKDDPENNRGSLQHIRDTDIGDGATIVRLDRTASRLIMLFVDDEKRTKAEAMLKIGGLKCSVGEDGALILEDANQLLLSGRLKIGGKGPELLICPPTDNPQKGADET
jgi:hypothetical protein